MRIFNTIAAILLFAIAGAAQAADFSGQAVIAGKGPVRDAVIYLEGGPSSHPMSHAMVDQRNKAFLPHVSVITQGTTVQFPNDDTVFHNVFAYFQAKKFDLGMYPRGASKSQTFGRTGLVVLLCNVHSDMSAYIMVVDTPYYAVTDKDGHFRIPNVAAGSYTLHAWHESGAVDKETVAVSSGHPAITVSLAKS